MLGELDKKKESLTQAVGLSTQAEGTRTLKSLLMFTMENCFYLLISQAVRYLRDPAVHPRDKQRMKQELSSELHVAFQPLKIFSEGEPPAPLLLESCPHHRARPPLSPKPAQSLRSL
ncbi:Nucleoporin NUP188 [Apodemus speciosus]|uniref:Nucleoporin NUP188 n=1 Tax=Apodemus speciosus TaxID=105296 RepID=A0ABQ0EGD7_APOSI